MKFRIPLGLDIVENIRYSQSTHLIFEMSMHKRKIKCLNVPLVLVMVAYCMLPILLCFTHVPGFRCQFIYTQINTWHHQNCWWLFFFNLVAFCQQFSALLRPVRERSRRAASMRKVTKECLLSGTLWAAIETTYSIRGAGSITCSTVVAHV